MDMAAEFPDANFTGFDIADDQFPEPDLLPDHVKFRGDFDVYRPLPAEYVSKFDVVHVRLLFVGVRANNVTPIMENLVKMLSASLSPTCLCITILVRCRIADCNLPSL